MIDWTINIGHAITALGFFAGAVGLIYVLRHDVTDIKSEIADMKVELRAMAGAMVQLARQEERLNSHDRRITKLEDRG
jgi:hypothetical protein